MRLRTQRQRMFSLARVTQNAPRALIVVVARCLDDGKFGQKTLQVQAHVQFGRRLLPAVLCPVHAVRDKLDRAGVDYMDHPLEATEEPPVRLAAKRGGHSPEVFKHCPEQILGQLR